MKKLLLFAIVILGFSAASFGQVAGNDLTVTTTASAKLLEVLTIDLTSGTLNFGAMTVPQDDATVTLTPGKSRSVTDGEGNLSLLEIAPAIDVPTYEVNGEIGGNFKINLPTTLALGTLTVNNFVSSIGTTPTLDGTGKRTFTVGADLVLDEEDEAGTYSADFEITIAYE